MESGLIFRIIGEETLLLHSERRGSKTSRISATTESILAEESNSTVTMDRPWVETEWIPSTLPTEAKAFSMGLVTVLSTSSGEASS